MSAKLFVGNLSFQATEEDLRELFAQAGTVRDAGGTTAFNIASKGVVVPVSHTGDPPELFKPGIPVVLEGHFDGDTFASDRIMVKHSEDYVAQHPDRVTVPPTTVP